MGDVREALARLVRTLDAGSAEDQERLGRYWDQGLADGDVQEDVYRRTDAILAEFDVVPRGEQVADLRAEVETESARAKAAEAEVERLADEITSLLLRVHTDEQQVADLREAAPAREVKPSEEDVARALYADDLTQGRSVVAWEAISEDEKDWYRSNARAVLALFAGRTVAEAEVKSDLADIPNASLPTEGDRR